MLLDELEAKCWVEAAHDYLRGTGGEAAGHEDDHSVNVIEGQEVEQYRVGAAHAGRQRLPDVTDQVVVAQHNAFWKAGGPAGVGQSGEVLLRIERDGVWIALRVGGKRPDIFDSEDVSQLGQVLANAVDKGLKRAHGEGGACTAVLELVKDFALLVQGVERGDNAAGEERPIEGDEVLGAVCREDGDPVTFLDPGVLEVPAQPAARLPRLAKGVALALRREERRLIAKALCGGGQELSQRNLRVRCEAEPGAVVEHMSRSFQEGVPAPNSLTAVPATRRPSARAWCRSSSVT